MAVHIMVFNNVTQHHERQSHWIVIYFVAEISLAQLSARLLALWEVATATYVPWEARLVGGLVSAP